MCGCGFRRGLAHRVDSGVEERIRPGAWVAGRIDRGARPQVKDRVRAPRPPPLGHAPAPARGSRACPPPSARRTIRSPSRNASGQRSARSAMYCAVHGPTPGSAVSAASVASTSTGRSSTTSPRCDGTGERDDRARRAPVNPSAASARGGAAASAAAVGNRRAVRGAAAGGRVGQRCAERRRESRQQRPRGGDADLLSGDGAHGELERIAGAGHAQSGPRRGERSQRRGDRGRIAAEVERRLDPRQHRRHRAGERRRQRHRSAHRAAAPGGLRSSPHASRRVPPPRACADTSSR